MDLHPSRILNSDTEDFLQFTSSYANALAKKCGTNKIATKYENQTKTTFTNDVTGSSVVDYLNSFSKTKKMTDQNSNSFLNEQSLNETFKTPVYSINGDTSIFQDSYYKSVDWCGNTKPLISSIRNEFCMNSNVGNRSHNPSFHSCRPKSMSNTHRYFTTQEGCQTVSSNEQLESNLTIKHFKTHVKSKENIFPSSFQMGLYPRRYPLRKGKRIVSDQSPLQYEYINLLEPATQLGIFDLASSSNHNNTRVSTATGKFRSQLTPRSEHTTIMLQHQSSNKTPPATPNSRPQTSHQVNKRPASNYSAKKQQRLHLGTPKTMVPVRRTAPSIPYVTGSLDKDLSQPFGSHELDHQNGNDPHFQNVTGSKLRRSTNTSRSNYHYKGGESFSSRPEMKLEGCGVNYSNSNTARSGVSQSKESRKTKPNSNGKDFVTSCLVTTRPIPVAHKVEDPDEELAKLVKWKDAVDNVDISRIFEKKYLPPNHAEKVSSQYIRQCLQEREAAIKIQKNYRLHLRRKHKIEQQSVSGMSIHSDRYRRRQIVDEKERQLDQVVAFQGIQQKNEEMTKELEKIGPHVDIYKHFHPVSDDLNDRQRYLAAMFLQKTIRGWLARGQMKKLETKSRILGFASLKAFLKYYNNLLKLIMKRSGARNPVVNYDFRQILTFMESKQRIDTAFEAVAHEGRISDDDLMTVLNGCGFHPARYELTDVLDSVYSHRENFSLTKEQFSGLVFHIFKPSATGMSNQRASTWMHPIIDGVDAESVVHPQEVGPVPLTSCIKLVLSSRLPDLSFDKQVEVRRHLRQLEKMEHLKAIRDAKAKRVEVVTRLSGSNKNIATPRELDVKPKIRWIKD